MLSGLFDALGLTSHNSGPGESQGTIEARQHLSDIFNLIFPSFKQEAEAYQQRLPQRMSSLDAAYQSLSPMNQAAQGEAYSRYTADQARRSGQRAINSNPGLSSGAQQGVMLDAQNRGQSAANSFFSKIYDPMYKSEAYRQQADVYNPNAVMGTYGMAANAAGAAYNSNAQGDQFRAAHQQPSVLDSILGIAGQAAPFFLGSRPSYGGGQSYGLMGGGSYGPTYANPTQQTWSF